MPSRDSKPRDGAAFGVISLTEIYTLDEARRRLCWTASSLRAARRRGLKLLDSGKRKYVTGTEILRFLENQPGSFNPGATPP
jgi:hypothetical protein